MSEKIAVMKIERTDEKGSGQYVVTPVCPTLEYKQSRATIWEMLELEHGESCSLKVTKLLMAKRSFDKLQEVESL